jgi:hypothetical protein
MAWHIRIEIEERAQHSSVDLGRKVQNVLLSSTKTLLEIFGTARFPHKLIINTFLFVGGGV